MVLIQSFFCSALWHLSLPCVLRGNGKKPVLCNCHRCMRERERGIHYVSPSFYLRPLSCLSQLASRVRLRRSWKFVFNREDSAFNLSALSVLLFVTAAMLRKVSGGTQDSAARALTMQVNLFHLAFRKVGENLKQVITTLTAI